MSNIATAAVRPGEYVVAAGNHMVGRVFGDHWFGYWAQTLDGARMERHFDSIDEAADVLALEFALHYGAAVNSAS